MKKFYIKTLGCDKNTVDSFGIAGLLEQNGLKQIEEAEKADYLIVNTCGFILDAKVQSIESIFDLINIKTEKQKLIVCGCLAQRYHKDLIKEIPEVDAFLGVDDYSKLLSIINSNNYEKDNVGRPSKTYCELPRKITKSYVSYLKIAEGCCNVCSYCSIPIMKGRYRSRSEDLILKEAKELAAAGTKELIIIAQDVTNYGADLNIEYGLPKLLHKLCKIDGIEWIRLMYCYENEITDELIQCIKEEPKICHYIDIPIQHCCTRILKDMNRRSTKASVTKTFKKLRKEIPDICLRTTFIVGFPGETKDEFNELYDFTQAMKFNRLGAFAYSKEEGTKAAKMPNQVRKDTKERRQNKIMELQRGISLNNNEALVGKTLRVIVDEQDDEGIYIGRSYMDAPEIDNSIIFKASKKLKPGDFVNVLINDAFDYDLTGEMIK